MLPDEGQRVPQKKQEVSLPVAVPPAGVVEVEAETALPSYSHLPLPEYLRRMFSHSPTFCTVWRQAASVAFSERRLLIRARRLIQLLAQLRTTRYRMEQHGLKVFCRLGCRTTLFRLAEVLAIFVVAANKIGGLTPEQMVPYLEQIVFDGLHEKYGPEIHSKDLSDILGGANARDFATMSGALVPSIQKHRCVLFPIHDLELAVHALVPPVAVTMLSRTQMGRCR